MATLSMMHASEIELMGQSCMSDCREDGRYGRYVSHSFLLPNESLLTMSLTVSEDV